MPLSSSTRHTGSIAVPCVCLVALGRPVLPAWGLPSLPALIKQQKLATVGGTLPPVWAHSGQCSCHCHSYFIFIPPSGSPESKGNVSAAASLQRVEKRGGVGEFGSSQPGPHRLRTAAFQSAEPMETVWCDAFISQQMGKQTTRGPGLPQR